MMEALGTTTDSRLHDFASGHRPAAKQRATGGALSFVRQGHAREADAHQQEGAIMLGKHTQRCVHVERRLAGNELAG